MMGESSKVVVEYVNEMLELLGAELYSELLREAAGTSTVDSW
jgi:hypothetical protein